MKYTPMTWRIIIKYIGSPLRARKAHVPSSVYEVGNAGNIIIHSVLCRDCINTVCVCVWHSRRGTHLSLWVDGLFVYAPLHTYHRCIVQSSRVWWLWLSKSMYVCVCVAMPLLWVPVCVHSMLQHFKPIFTAKRIWKRFYEWIRSHIIWMNVTRARARVLARVHLSNNTHRIEWKEKVCSCAMRGILSSFDQTVCSLVVMWAPK